MAAIRARGHVICGVSNGVAGFSAADAQGKWGGFDVDLCRAVAAATLGDANMAKYRPLEAGEGLTALRNGEIDLLTRPYAETLELETHGIISVGVSFFDSQSLLVPKSLALDSTMQLSGARICLVDDPRQRLGLVTFFAQRKMTVQLKVFDRRSDAIAAFESRACEALSVDQSQVTNLRAMLKTSSPTMLLSPVLAVHGLGPMVRGDDFNWVSVTRWTLIGLIAAEQIGFDQAQALRAGERSASSAQFLSAAADFGPRLGLSSSWAETMIAAVGNYGEVFDRNLGPRSAAGLDRGFNRLWGAGGLMVAPELR